MCDQTHNNGQIDKNWDRHNDNYSKDWDRCNKCGMHFSMCECGRSRSYNNNDRVDIYGPDYPPC